MENIDIDENIDIEIASYLDIDNPKSFFLFAGAGSGKTRSLINALKAIKNSSGEALQLKGQRVAVITYTNAACEEIKHRLDHNPLFSVSTIHSFVWQLIQSYHSDIKSWLVGNLNEEILDIEEKQLKGRPGTKAAINRAKKIESKKNRLRNLSSIMRFVYNPNGDNKTKDSLNHSEVIGIAAYFLNSKVLLRKILISEFPIILVDESQDTNKHLMESLFSVQEQNSSNFSLGLFGDTMQRIYLDGKADLGVNLPDGWETPAKKMNYRCPKRVVELLNKIRSEADGQKQVARDDSVDGFVQLFVVSSSNRSKQDTENLIKVKMSEIAKDVSWVEQSSEIKVLTLEHHMAATRMGFFNLFEPLYKMSSLQTGLLEGTLSGLRLFSNYILPLVNANEVDDDFAIARIVRENSPLLRSDLLAKSNNQKDEILKAKKAVDSLLSLWSNANDPKLIDIFTNVSESKLFEIPDSLKPFEIKDEDVKEPIDLGNPDAAEDDEDKNDVSLAWMESLNVCFSELRAYNNYVSKEANFGTHQGVKGLEFSNVMVILDDEEARGFLFSYEKLFGAKELSATDLKNEQEGKETGVERTRRLFYVTCSRSMKSLAIVAYSNNPSQVKQHAINQGWFTENEIILI